LQGGVVCHFGDGPGPGHLPGIGGHDTGNVRPDLQGIGLQGGGIEGGAVVRTAAAQGAHPAFRQTADETGGYVDFGLLLHRAGDVPVSEVLISFDYKLAGVQPAGFVTIGLQLGGQNGGGEDFSVGDFFGIRSGQHFLEEGI